MLRGGGRKCSCEGMERLPTPTCCCSQPTCPRISRRSTCTSCASSFAFNCVVLPVGGDALRFTSARRPVVVSRSSSSRRGSAWGRQDAAAARVRLWVIESVGGGVRRVVGVVRLVGHVFFNAPNNFVCYALTAAWSCWCACVACVGPVWSCRRWQLNKRNLPSRRPPKCRTAS